MEELYKRLLQVFDNERLDSASKIEKKFDFTHTSATNYFKKGRVPATEHILKIKQKLDYLDLNWLFTGEGQMQGKGESNAFPNEEKIRLLEDKMILLEENRSLLKEINKKEQEISILKIENLKLEMENTELKKVHSSKENTQAQQAG